MTRDQHDGMVECVACSGVVAYAGHKERGYLMKIGDKWKICGDKSDKRYSHKSVTLSEHEYESGGL